MSAYDDIELLSVGKAGAMVGDKHSNTAFHDFQSAITRGDPVFAYVNGVLIEGSLYDSGSSLGINTKNSLQQDIQKAGIKSCTNYSTKLRIPSLASYEAECDTLRLGSLQTTPGGLFKRFKIDHIDAIFPCENDGITEVHLTIRTPRHIPFIMPSNVDHNTIVFASVPGQKQCYTFFFRGFTRRLFGGGHREAIYSKVLEFFRLLSPITGSDLDICNVQIKQDGYRFTRHFGSNNNPTEKCRKIDPIGVDHQLMVALFYRFVSQNNPIIHDLIPPLHIYSTQCTFYIHQFLLTFICLEAIIKTIASTIPPIIVADAFNQNLLNQIRTMLDSDPTTCHKSKQIMKAIRAKQKPREDSIRDSIIKVMTYQSWPQNLWDLEKIDQVLESRNSVTHTSTVSDEMYLLGTSGDHLEAYARQICDLALLGIIGYRGPYQPRGNYLTRIVNAEEGD